MGPTRGENWVVVTSAARLPRTMACFQAAGWNVIRQPADHQGLVAVWEPGSYRLTGRTRVLFPGP